jgi:hypothetical protein
MLDIAPGAVDVAEITENRDMLSAGAGWQAL